MKRVIMYFKRAVFITCAVLTTCDSLYVETLSKCNIGDDDCSKNLVTKVIKDISKSGIEEMEVPALDPMHLQNIQIPITGLINMTLVDGTLKGVKDCEIHSLHHDFKKGVTTLDFTVDLSLKGKVKVSETSPFLQGILGSAPITIDGITKLKFDKLHMKMKFFYHFYKNDDGDVYFKCHLDDFVYEYEIGNVKLSAEKINLGGQDATQLVVGLFNQNWKLLMQTFGQGVFDIAVPILKDIIHKFFDTVPAKHYIMGDLTQFVKDV